MKKIQKNKEKRRSGFSLIEVLVTITFLAIGLIGVLAFFNSSLQSNTEAKNELIAANLAQEGNELARNLAEYKKLNGDSWNAIKTFLVACSHIDYRSLGSHSCQNSSNNYICLESGRYKQCDSGTGVGIQRTFSVIDQGANGLYVKSEVTWSGRITKAEDRLYENEY